MSPRPSGYEGDGEDSSRGGAASYADSAAPSARGSLFRRSPYLCGRALAARPRGRLPLLRQYPWPGDGSQFAMVSIVEARLRRVDDECWLTRADHAIAVRRAIFQHGVLPEPSFHLQVSTRTPRLFLITARSPVFVPNAGNVNR